MLFVEQRFFLFFLIVFLVYWAIPSNRWRKRFLLLASFFFYSAWDARFACMLLALAAADWYLAVRIQRSGEPRVRKILVSASVAMNLLVLFYFKYFHFFVENAVALAGKMGMQLDQPTLHILLPVGVSFFTFQSLSYTIDVYRREIPAVPSALDYLMFASFFPQLVAGPIVRPKYFVPQMQQARVLTVDEVKQSLYLFLLGFLKKVAVADNISPYVDKVFSAPEHFTRLSSITATWLYAAQIFCDFSGYSDMAIAVAGLLGYRLAINFDAPYLATSIQDFWRRWHISLSSWIRDYIFISLGGSRMKHRILTYRNLMLTMLAGGLWHGAAWTFVAWGAAHGSAQIVHSEFRHRVSLRGRSRQKATGLVTPPQPSRFGTFVSWFLTLNFVCLCWILFRASSFGSAALLIRRYFFLAPGGTETIPLWLAGFAATLLLLQMAMRQFRIQNRFIELRLPWFSFVYGVCWAFAISMLPLGYRPFIYFQF